MHHVHTSSFHAQTNSTVERVNAEILKSLRCYCEDQANWSKFIPSIMYSFRSSVNSSTGLSPYFVVFGREMHRPNQVELDKPSACRTLSAQEYVDSLKERLREIHALAVKNTRDAQTVQKSNYDKDCHVVNFNVGDKVWITNMKRRKGISPKLQKKFIGPYILVRQTGPLNFLLKDANTYKLLNSPVHVNRMKPYIDDRDLLGSANRGALSVKEYNRIQNDATDDVSNSPRQKFRDTL